MLDGGSTMSNDIEILYPEDATGGPDRNSTFAEDLKIVRIARLVREMRIRSDAHVAVIGLLSTSILMQSTDEMEKDRSLIKETLWRARQKLLQSQLDEGGIRVYVPFQCAPIIRPGQVMLFARNSAPAPAKPYLWGQPRIQPAVAPEIEASINMVYDLHAREEDKKKEEERTRLLECQVEIKLWDTKGNARVMLLPDGKVTLTFGPNGVEEVSGEATALSVRLGALDLEKKINSGEYVRVEIAIKGEGTINIEKGKAERLLAEWEAKLKLSLTTQLRIPKTTIVLPPIEVTPYVNNEGKPGIQFQITVYKW